MQGAGDSQDKDTFGTEGRGIHLGGHIGKTRPSTSRKL